MKPSKRILARALMVLFGIVLVEITLRIAGISFPIFDAYDHDRVLKLKPGKEGRYDKEGSGYLRINSLGYRDDEHTRQKAPGVFRIAVLGDSFTEARQVELDETYWKRLENILNDGLGPDSDIRIEVLNFGIGGYGRAEELLTLRLDALSFSPDLVLLGFFSGNDLVNNLEWLSVRIRNESVRPFFVLVDGELALDDSFRDPSISLAIRRFLLTATHHFRILEVVNQIRRLVVVRRTRADRTKDVPRGGVETVPGEELTAELGVRAGQFVSPPHPDWAAAWTITEALLAEMKRESASVGAIFVVVTISTAFQVHPDPSVRARYAAKLGVPDLLYPERRLHEIARREGFGLIPLVEAMQRKATERNTYLHGFENTTWGKGHWNDEGHALAAELIAAGLISRGLTPEER